MKSTDSHDIRGSSSIDSGTIETNECLPNVQVNDE